MKIQRAGAALLLGLASPLSALVQTLTQNVDNNTIVPTAPERIQPRARQ